MSDTIQRTNPTGMELLAELSRKTDDPQVAVAVAKAAVDLQIQMERFQWEREERQGKIDFDEALARCQAAIPQIKPDSFNKHTRSWWQRYETIDKVCRPIYTSEGFSLSFGERDCPVPDKVRVVAFLSRSGQTREFLKDVTPPSLGAKGGAVMSATHGDASANSYGRRYLLIDIFNISKAIGETDTDGNPLPPMDQDLKDQRIKQIREAKDLQIAKNLWHQAAREAREAKDDLAKGELMTAFEEARERLTAGKDETE